MVVLLGVVASRAARMFIMEQPSEYVDVLGIYPFTREIQRLASDPVRTNVELNWRYCCGSLYWVTQLLGKNLLLSVDLHL